MKSLVDIMKIKTGLNAEMHGLSQIKAFWIKA
jgi:hypothetical protein